MANNATGNAIQSAYTGTAATVLLPSGDTTGVTDSTVLSSALNSNAHTILAAGTWYVTGVTLNQSFKWIQGSGPGTVINVLASDTGFTVSNPSQFYMSDMAFTLNSGSLGIQVNGATDAHFWNLYFQGTGATGGIAINGDDSMEQHYTDIVFRSVGGDAFSYTRTTTTDTGGLYLDRVRTVAPPSTATHGFKFTSSAVGVTPIFLFMDQCIADSYYNDAILINNCANTRITESWFTLNALANSGKVPVHITAGFNHNLEGSYTYQPLTTFCVLIDGSTGAHEVQIGGGWVFDGVSGATALGLAAAGGNFRLGSYYNYTNTLTDTPTALSVNIGSQAPPTFQTSGSGGSSNCLAIDDTANPGNQMWIRNAAGTLQFLNTAFSASPFRFLQNGDLFLTTGNLDVNLAGKGLKVAEGSNAKQGTAVLNGTTNVVVANTSVTASSRIFLTHQSNSGTPGVPYVTARSAGTSFTIVSTAATDLGTVAYEIFEPG